MNMSRRVLRVPSVSAGRAIFACAVALAAFAAACADGTGVESGVCVETREFKSRGCARVHGRVLAESGQPIAGADVTPEYLRDRVCCNSVLTHSGADGAFSFLINYYDVDAPPDTASIYVRVVYPMGEVRIADSVLVTVPFAPIGSRAVSTFVEVILALP